MEAATSGSLVGRRLDRLRSATPRPATVGAGRAVDHAALVAQPLWAGRSFNGELGPVVVVETEFEVPIEIDRLTRLPYPIDPRAPLVCIDLETTGLATAAGTLAFLVGVGIWCDGHLTSASSSCPITRANVPSWTLLASLLPSDGWLVTYNGKSFDWPLLTARYRLHRRAPPVLAGHLDLLPVARQLWKHRLGGARLAIVEQALCGVERHDDLPGHLIPERYFAYLRSRRPTCSRRSSSTTGRTSSPWRG